MFKFKLSNFQKGFILTMLGAICWGLSGVFGEYLLNVRKFDSLWLITNRLFYSGILLVLLSALIKKKEIFLVFKNKKDTIRLIIFTFLGLFICQASYFLAILYSNAGTATVLQYLGPTMIMSYYCIRNKIFPKGREVLAILFSLLGTFSIATHFNFSALIISALGLFWGVASAFGLASYNVLSINLTKKYSVMHIVGLSFLIAGTLTTPILSSFFIPAGFTFKDFLAFSAVVVVGTVFTFTVYLEGVKLIGAVKGSILSCFEPVSAIVFSFLLLGTNFSFYDIIGSIFILTAVIFLSKTK